MNLISPVQIKGGKKLFDDVSTMQVQIKDLITTTEAANTQIEELYDFKSEMNTNSNTINKNFTHINNQIVTVFSQKVEVGHPAQVEFLLNLSALEDKEISDHVPVKVSVNGIYYFEPDFSIDFETNTLTWLATEENGGFNLDIEDNVRVEIPLKNASPEVFSAEEINDDFTVVTQVLINDYYNKYPNISNVEVEDSDYYVKVISNVGLTPTTILVNGAEISGSETTTLSIGNNGFIKKPAYKIIEDDLYIASPLLYTYIDNTGVIKFEVNGAEYTVQLETNFKESPIVLSEVFAKGKADGHSVTLTTDEETGLPMIVEERTHGTSYLAYLLTVDGQPIPEDTMMFIKKTYNGQVNKNYAMERAENNTYTNGMYNYYLNGNIVEPKNRVFNYHITIPEYGVIEFLIKVVESVPTTE